MHTLDPQDSCLEIAFSLVLVLWLLLSLGLSARGVEAGTPLTAVHLVLSFYFSIDSRLRRQQRFTIPPLNSGLPPCL